MKHTSMCDAHKYSTFLLRVGKHHQKDYPEGSPKHDIYPDTGGDPAARFISKLSRVMERGYGLETLGEANAKKSSE